MDKPSSKFYSLKPTMLVYWYTVNTMVNQIAVNRGLYPSGLKQQDAGQPGEFYGLSTEAMGNLNKLMPDIFAPDGGIDVYSVANRAKRIKNELDKRLSEIIESGDSDTFRGYVDRYSEALDEVTGKFVGQSKNRIANAINSWFSSPLGKTAGTEDDKKNIGTEESILRFDSQTGKFNGPDLTGWDNHIKAEYDDGSEFASFRVDATGAVGESFSNNFAENDLASKFNNLSSSSKAAYFSFAGYNVSDVLKPAQDAIANLAGGILDTVGFSGLLALAGSAFVDIPKNWENSIANLPKANYSITLISPYGNVISQMTNIYIPLCMLLAGSLPLQTGNSSYTSPFLCELYDRGRQQTRLGMIDSINIQRGTSNLSFNKIGNPMAIEVTFSVADLSSVLSIPIVQRTFVSDALESINPLSSMFSDVSAFTDYMNTLSSLTLTQQTYRFSILQLRAAQKARRMSQVLSKARLASIAHNFTPTGIFDIFFEGTDRLQSNIIEPGFNPGSMFHAILVTDSTKLSSGRSNNGKSERNVSMTASVLNSSITSKYESCFLFCIASCFAVSLLQSAIIFAFSVRLTSSP